MNTSSLDSALLAQVEERVREALASLDAREQTRARPAPAGLADWRDPLHAARAKLVGLQAHARTGATRLNELDTALADDERGLRGVLADAAELRQKLAAWTGRAIG